MISRSFRFRFGLRSFLVFVACLSLFLSVRAYERKVLLAARHQLESRGGTVFYHWQRPEFRKEHRSRQSSVSPYSEYTITWIEAAAEAVRCSEFEGFLSGRHKAIQIEAVDLTMQDIDEELVDTLKRLKQLKTIKVRAGTMPLAPESWSGTRDEWIRKCDDEHGQKWQLLERTFPGKINN